MSDPIVISAEVDLKKILAESWRFYAEQAMSILGSAKVGQTSSLIEKAKEEATKSAEAEYAYAGFDNHRRGAWRSHHHRALLLYGRGAHVDNCFHHARKEAVELALAEEAFSESITPVGWIDADKAVKYAYDPE